jgi:hypothetical protein
VSVNIISTFCNISCLYCDIIHIIISRHDILKTSKAQNYFLNLGTGALRRNQTEQFLVLIPANLFSTRQ